MERIDMGDYTRENDKIPLSIRKKFVIFIEFPVRPSSRRDIIEKSTGEKPPRKEVDNTMRLENGRFLMQVEEKGAEITSLYDKAREKELIWDGDPAFWARHAPILFPHVGRTFGDVLRIGNRQYASTQHGFARDRVFKADKVGDGQACFTLRHDEETMKKYPFPFVLEIGYRLKGNRIEVMWSVQNTGNETMYFQIGAHPAFYYRDLDPVTNERGFLDFGKNKKTLEFVFPTEKGCTPEKRETLTLNEGMLELTPATFQCDTYIFENNQLKKITLTDKQKNPYLSLEFESPLVAVWSPSVAHPDVPFVCIEPWYGRCDTVGYHGEFKDRRWMQVLEPDKSFEASYSIVLEDIK